MVLRRRADLLSEKENECPDQSRTEHIKLNRANGRSPISQRRREKSERNSPNKRDQSREPLTGSFIREGGAVDGFLLAQRALRTRFGNVFQQLRENEARSKDDVCKDFDEQEETIKPTGNSQSTRRSSRNGTEKRNHFHFVLMELKTRVWKTGKETNIDCVLQENVAHLSSGETHHVPPLVEGTSDRFTGERTFFSPQSSTNTVTAWLSRPRKRQRSSVEGATRQSRKSPSRWDHSNRGGNPFFGPGVLNFASFPFPHNGEEYLHQRTSLDTKSQWGRARARRQARKRNVALRRTQSSSSLQPQRGSDFFLDTDVLVELSKESSLLDKMQELRTSLERSEKALSDFIAESTKNRAEIQEQIDRLTKLYSSLSQSQDIRYRSLLDVFHENYKLLGYVESNFDYVLSVVARGRRTNLQGRFFDLLRFIADHTMAPFLCVVRFGSRIYLRLFPRRTGANG